MDDTTGSAAFFNHQTGELKTVDEMEQDAKTDDKGRAIPNEMTVDEKLNEVLETMRMLSDAFEKFNEAASSNPMLKMFLPKVK